MLLTSDDFQPPSTVLLKLDWDTPLEPPRPGRQQVGHYVGRDHELQFLANEIVRSPQRSILIAGYRGVGKTTLVYRALREVLEHAPAGRKFVFVLLNAAQLEVGVGGNAEILPKEILVNLIRRLYTAARDTDSVPKALRRRIAELYRRAIAAEFIERHQLGSQLAHVVREERHVDVRWKFDATDQVVWALSLVLATAVQFSKPLHFDFVNHLVPLLLAAPIPLSIQLAHHRRRSQTAEASRGFKASKLYAFDANLGNLEFDLENIHRDLTKSKVTTVYVIDELDKIRVEAVIEVLKFFKNLFTLSSAVFIFLAGERLGQRFTEPNPTDDDYRPLEYTYFTSQYYLSRPDWRDLEAFLDEVVDEVNAESTDAFEQLKQLLVFQARSDFFDLLQKIRDRISSFGSDGRPVIQLQTFTEREERAARLQRLLALLFDTKYRVFAQSRWSENEAVLRELYDVATKVDESYSGAETNDTAQSSVEAAAARDFRVLLSRQGVLAISDTAEAEIRGQVVAINSYEVTGSYRFDVPAEISELSEFEQRFVQIAAAYFSSLGVMVNAARGLARQRLYGRSDLPLSTASVGELAKYGYDGSESYEEILDVYGALTEGEPPRLNARETIEEDTRKAEAANAEVYQHAANVLAQLVAARVPTASVAGIHGDPNVLQDHPMRGELADLPHAIVVTSEYKKQAVFVTEAGRSSFEGHRGALGKNASKYRIVAVGPPEPILRKLRTLKVIDWDIEKSAQNRETLDRLIAWMNQESPG